jgi:predicted nuclease of predicted toxin-antitoxin system
MKLLLDENLSRRIVPFLQADYPGSTQKFRGQYT